MSHILSELLALLPEEEATLRKCAQRVGVELGADPAPIFADVTAKWEFYRECAGLLGSDGIIDNDERRALDRLRAKLELPTDAPPKPALAFHRGDETEESSPWKPVFIGAGLIAAVVAVALVWSGWNREKREAAEAFDPYMRDLLFPLVEEPTEQKDLEEPLQGKLIVVDTTNKDIDELHWSLPPERRAASYGEVGTVIWITWGSEAVGTYSDGATGYASTIAVTVIDHATRKFVAYRRFRGSDPPSVKKQSGSAYGTAPDSAVKDYLAGLK